jgi:flagellar biogenesis protein FliO
VKPTLVPTNTPVKTDEQTDSMARKDEIGTNRTKTSDEELGIQQKLTWFTGVLAGVGVLQLVVMFLTWLVYRRQAHEMRRQRHERLLGSKRTN